jgi:DnaJ-domain-containing protein 1
MPDSRWGRFRKKGDDEPDAPKKETVDLNSQEHAWWANRDRLDSQEIPHGRPKQKVREEEPKKPSFEDYYSTASLFEPVAEVLDEDDPYTVLGVPPSATWEEIMKAHRRLAKMFHPDRLTDMSKEEQARGEVRIRDLNIAYMELRRRRGK